MIDSHFSFAEIVPFSSALEACLIVKIDFGNGKSS